MGLYVQLLVRYLRLDVACLLASLRDAGISIAYDARSVFLDPAPRPSGHALAGRSSGRLRFCPPSGGYISFAAPYVR
jgi:hypothetical protein